MDPVCMYKLGPVARRMKRGARIEGGVDAEDGNDVNVERDGDREKGERRRGSGSESRKKRKNRHSASRTTRGDGDK